MKNMEDFLSENGMEALSAVTEMVIAQQSIALDLTRLVLEHCVEGTLSKEEVFEVYEEACDLLRSESVGS